MAMDWEKDKQNVRAFVRDVIRHPLRTFGYVILMAAIAIPSIFTWNYVGTYASLLADYSVSTVGTSTMHYVPRRVETITTPTSTTVIQENCPPQPVLVHGGSQSHTTINGFTFNGPCAMGLFDLDPGAVASATNIKENITP